MNRQNRQIIKLEIDRGATANEKRLMTQARAQRIAFLLRRARGNHLVNETRFLAHARFTPR